MSLLADWHKRYGLTVFDRRVLAAISTVPTSVVWATQNRSTKPTAWRLDEDHSPSAAACTRTQTTFPWAVRPGLGSEDLIHMIRRPMT